MNTELTTLGAAGALGYAGYQGYNCAQYSRLFQKIKTSGQIHETLMTRDAWYSRAMLKAELKETYRNYFDEYYKSDYFKNAHKINGLPKLSRVEYALKSAGTRYGAGALISLLAAGVLGYFAVKSYFKSGE